MKTQLEPPRANPLDLGSLPKSVTILKACARGGEKTINQPLPQPDRDHLKMTQNDVASSLLSLSFSSSSTASIKPISQLKKKGISVLLLSRRYYQKLIVFKTNATIDKMIYLLHTTQMPGYAPFKT
jgi:hypothetical protein